MQNPTSGQNNVMLTKEELEMVWRLTSGGRMITDGGSPVVMQPDLTMMGSVTANVMTSTVLPTVMAANGPQSRGQYTYLHQQIVNFQHEQ
ncbi:hypothetical protein ACJMK2_021478 [Sinanodonta woodiana]|uniref:Uncharacterized protein n=1 Tax=Sinanodonta woodiana TaxID=1069815 RepID=A0ABD3TH54_SINWO